MAAILAGDGSAFLRLLERNGPLLEPRLCHQHNRHGSGAGDTTYQSIMAGVAWRPLFGFDKVPEMFFNEAKPEPKEWLAMSTDWRLFCLYTFNDGMNHLTEPLSSFILGRQRSHYN